MSVSPERQRVCETPPINFLICFLEAASKHLIKVTPVWLRACNPGSLEADRVSPAFKGERASCWRGQGSARLLLRSLTQWLGRGSEGASVGLIVRGQDGGSVMRCLCLVFSLPSSPRLYSALGECRRGCWRSHRSHGQIFLNDLTN